MAVSIENSADIHHSNRAYEDIKRSYELIPMELSVAPAPSNPQENGS